NLAGAMVLTGINQLWVADITYIRLQLEFVYLAVLLDAFSRRCIGWALQRSLEAALVLEALRMALTERRPGPGLVHHSDSGVQYASHDYTAQREQHGIRISMSRVATPYDNAQIQKPTTPISEAGRFRGGLTGRRNLRRRAGILRNRCAVIRITPPRSRG